MLAAMQAHSVIPILNVSSLQESFAWFAKLGWATLWEWGSPPTFGAVGDGTCEIYLCVDGQGARGVWMSIFVEDVDAVLETCLEEGVLIIRPPHDEPWGVREMHIRHADGHVFRISQDIDHAHHHENGHSHEHDHPHEHVHSHEH